MSPVQKQYFFSQLSIALLLLLVMTCAGGLSLAWPQRTGTSQKTRQHQNMGISLDDELSFPSVCRLSGRLALSLRPQLHSSLKEVKLGIRANYANSNQWTGICDGLSNYIKLSFEKVSLVFHPSNSCSALHFLFLSFSFSA